MIRFLRELFSKEPKIYAIEKRDVKINKEIFELVINSEKLLDELKSHLSSNNIPYKDAKLAEFENSLLNMKSKIDTLKIDVQKILNIELQNKDYILLNDDFYLKDKLARLDTMSQIVEELLDLISERPAIPELKELINYIYSRMSSLVDSINNITGDDKRLEEVYSRLEDL